MKPRPRHHVRRLLPGAAQRQRPPGVVQGVGELLDRVQPGAVDRRHVAQAQDDDRRQRVDMIDDQPQLVGRPEEKRSVNAEDLHVGRNGLVLEDVHVPFPHVLVGHRRDRGGLRDAVDEEQGRQHHADADRDRQVGEHRE
jgi:hypothetical protein